MSSVYLAGPISGCSYKGCTNWRKKFADKLPGIDCYDPMRAKFFLEGCLEIDDHYDCNPLSTVDAIWSRDLFDCTRCDVLVVNLLGATIVSIGTMFEMAWASLLLKPIVLIMEPENNLHEHAFVNKAAGFRVSNLDDGVAAVKAILG